MSNHLKISTRLLLFIITLIVSGCQQNQKDKETIDTTATNYYQEQHRPQLHFTPEANWMNDPNGMFYYEGKYHLFYQYYPDSIVWGPMHWGHAQTEDLVHWEHLPIGLYPDSIGCIFSGGAIVDHNNTSGLGTQTNPPIVATFTHHDFVGEKAKTNDFQKQSIAYSLDGGAQWKKYDGNPVIPNTEKIKDFRDPKVVWHPSSQQWVLALAAYDRVKFYGSKNLTEWSFISDFGIEGDQRLWECPDLFPMKVEGTDETKWVLIVSIQKEAPNGGTATSYFVGDFNGKEYIADVSKQKWLDWGTDNYAFVTWNNVPETDGRVIGMGWMSNWQYAQIVPTKKWRSAMTLPRELVLVNKNNDFQIQSTPVAEIASLRGEKTTFGNLTISEQEVIDGPFDPTQSEYEFSIDTKNTSAASFTLKFENELGESYSISFDKEKGKMFVDRTQSSTNNFSKEFFAKVHEAPLSFDKANFDVRIIMDASSAEIFVDNGALSFTSIFFPSEKFNQVSLISQSGSLSLSELNI